MKLFLQTSKVRNGPQLQFCSLPSPPWIAAGCESCAVGSDSALITSAWRTGRGKHRGNQAPSAFGCMEKALKSPKKHADEHVCSGGSAKLAPNFIEYHEMILNDDRLQSPNIIPHHSDAHRRCCKCLAKF